MVFACSRFQYTDLLFFFNPSFSLFLSHTSSHTGPFRAADRAAGYGVEMNEKSGWGLAKRLKEINVFLTNSPSIKPLPNL